MSEETKAVEENLQELQAQNAEKVQELTREFPGLLDANMVVLLKIRLDAVTRVLLDVLANLGVENAELAVNLTFEENYRDFLTDVQAQARKAKLAAQPQGSGLVVAKR